MYFSSDQGESFSRALLPSASTEQVRHPEVMKKIGTKLEYVQKPGFRISNIRIVHIGSLQELLLCGSFLLSLEQLLVTHVLVSWCQWPQCLL